MRYQRRESLTAIEIITVEIVLEIVVDSRRFMKSPIQSQSFTYSLQCDIDMMYCRVYVLTSFQGELLLNKATNVKIASIQHIRSVWI
jgi:hypothetical protein